MPHIQKRVSEKTKRPTYRIQHQHNKKRYNSPSFSTEKEAWTWFYENCERITKGQLKVPSERDQYTVSRTIDRYIHTKLRSRTRTKKDRSYQLEWWREHIGRMVLDDVNPAVLSHYRDILQYPPTKNVRSNATINRYLAALSHVFTIACNEWMLCENNPCLKLSKLKESPPRDRYLSNDEIKKLYAECCNSRYSLLGLIFLIAIATGMRRGEILNLRKRDIVLDAPVPHFVVAKSKNGKPRFVPVSEPLLTRCTELLHTADCESAWAFPSPRDPNKPVCIKNAYSNAVKRAKIEDYNFHDNRHTAASLLAMNGTSTVEIATILGHSSMEMVKRYAGMSLKSTQRTLNDMNKEILNDL